jgi:hypothetical protein
MPREPTFDEDSFVAMERIRIMPVEELFIDCMAKHAYLRLLY